MEEISFNLSKILILKNLLTCTEDHFERPSLKSSLSLFPTFHHSPHYAAGLIGGGGLGGGGGGVGGQPVEAMGVVGPGGLVDRSLSVDAGSADPPPLPPKKKHIMSYMEMFGHSVLPASE